MKNKLFTFIIVLFTTGIFNFAHSINFNQEKNTIPKADFNFVIDTMRNVTFSNISSGNITKYEWDFGDGNFSNEINPTHNYSQNGNFQVCLTIYDAGINLDTYCENINIEGLNTISGKIFAGPNLLSEGEIYLVGAGKNNFKIASSTTIENGKYTFNNVQTGDYTFYVIPNFDFNFHYYPKYIATYSGYFFKWENAGIISVDGSRMNEDIHLISYNKAFYGHASIKGNFKYEDGFSPENRIPGNIILLNENKEPMDFRPVDTETGDYIFDELPYGKYYIHPEIAGLKSYDIELELTPENSMRSDMNFNINDEIKIISEDDFPPNKPNNIDIIFSLKKGNINIKTDKKINEPVICELFDMSGKSVLNCYKTPPNITIDANDINSGLYILRLRTYAGKSFGTKKIVFEK